MEKCVRWRVLVKRGRQTSANATGGGFKGAHTEIKKSLSEINKRFISVWYGTARL